MKLLAVALRQCAQGGTGRRRDGVEDAQQRIALAMRRLAAETVAGDQLGVVEVVARVHAHALRQAAAHGDFLVLVEQRNLDAVDLVRVRRDDAYGRVHGRIDVLRAPVARQRRVEHVAQPVQHHGLLRLAQDAVVHALVVGGAFCHAGQCAARHHDQLAAERLDGGHLLLVAADHVVDALHVVDVQVVGAAARGDERAGHVLRGIERAADQFERGRPIQAHAALRGVHRLGHAQAQGEQVAAVGDGGVPVDRALQPRVDGGERVGDDVRGRVGDAVELDARFGLDRRGAAQGVGRERAARGGEGQRQCHGVCFVRPSARAHRPNGGLATTRARPRPAARPWRLRAASTCKARSRPRGE
ncbi:hypothetical protein D9M68_524250 [compost metagenome]